MDGIKELHDKKNHDYAEESNPYSNFEYSANLLAMFKDPVDQAFAGRIGDKLARLGQLLSGKEPNYESIRDTMIDLTTYCGIWTARYIDTKPRTFEDDDKAWQELHPTTQVGVHSEVTRMERLAEDAQS